MVPKLLFHPFYLSLLFCQGSCRAGSRGGGGTFGRGGGGARAGVGRAGVGVRIHGSSHFSGGIRSGAFGWKKYDNRFYYWSSSYAQENLSPVEFPTICEYTFGVDDGDLQNVTFSNGTSATSLYFGCTEMVKCCGMYCCHAIGEYIQLILFLVLLVAIIPFMIWCEGRKKRNRAEKRKVKRQSQIPVCPSKPELIKLNEPPNEKKEFVEAQREVIVTIT
uniref:CX domain-containing protein n=2 Tax=Caenorhabditis japonica TaxID=281687 RepID=A0A8R1HWG9_CAEJA